MIDIAMNLAFLRGDNFSKEEPKAEPAKSSMTGVCFNKKLNRYRVEINKIYLGVYQTLEEAEAAATLYNNTLGALK